MVFSKRLAWLGRKIASKDASYLVRRTSYTLRKRWVDLRFPTRRQSDSARFHPRSSELENPARYLQGRSRPRWHFDPSDIEDIVCRIPPEYKKRTISEAQEILERRFALRGLGPIKVDPLNWDHSPTGDMAWTRDLNRHACFEVLGFAYRYTSDNQYAKGFVELSNSWIDEVASRLGRLDWDTPFQLARRMNSWIWSVFLFLDAPEWKALEQRRFLHTLGVLAEYLHQTIEYHSPGNHILLEAKTLALCAELFPEFEGAGRWRSKAWEALDRELEVQICRDGVHAERSTMYHRIIAGELAELWCFLARNDSSRALVLEPIVRRMAEFQRWIDLGEGQYPLFGDSVGTDSYYRFSAPVIVAAKSGARLPLESGVMDHTWWVQQIGKEAPPLDVLDGGKAFPQGGYYVARFRTPRGPSVLVWDCGPMGYELNRKHAHADALSMALSVEGQPVLIDLGQGVDARKTCAHNTVAIDGEDQAVLADRNEIWNPPEGKVILWRTSVDHVVMWGRHEGYRRLPEPVKHDRVIIAGRQGYWIILDLLTGEGQHTAELVYHFASHTSLDEKPPNRVEIARDGVEVYLTLFGPWVGDPTFRLHHEGSQRSPEVPASLPRISATFTGEVPIVLATFVASATGGWEPRSVELDDSVCIIETANGRTKDRIVVRFDATDLSHNVEIERHDETRGLSQTWAFESTAISHVGIDS